MSKIGWDKNRKIPRSIKVFFESKERFDRKMTGEAIDLILDATREVEKPTKVTVSTYLGIDRNRLARLLKDLEIQDEFNSIAQTKRKLRDQG